MPTPCNRLLKSPWVWVATALVGLAAAVAWPWSGPQAEPLTQLEPERPFRVEFGRGSGSHGLDTVKVDEDGRVTLYRLKWAFDQGAYCPYVEKAVLILRHEVMAELKRAVEESCVLGLQKEYYSSAPNGTKWVLWVRQGAKEKAVFCDNQFPDEVAHFAKALDGILAANGLKQAEWTRVSEEEGQGHDQDLWASIGR